MTHTATLAEVIEAARELQDNPAVWNAQELAASTMSGYAFVTALDDVRAEVAARAKVMDDLNYAGITGELREAAYAKYRLSCRTRGIYEREATRRGIA